MQSLLVAPQINIYHAASPAALRKGKRTEKETV